MGKTKRLVEDLQEQQAIEQSEVTTPTNPVTRTVKMRGISNELNDALVNYLAAKPYAEVSNLLGSLSQAPVLDVTLNG